MRDLFALGSDYRAGDATAQRFFAEAQFSDRPVLQGAGAVSAVQAEAVAHEHDERFDAQRRREAALAADADDVAALEKMETRVKGKTA